MEGVTLHLGTAWHEVATMERLFPALPGMAEYKETLRRITKASNKLLLDVVEDLTYVYSDGRENRWDPAEIEKGRLEVLEEVLAERDDFIYRHQTVLLDALEQGNTPLVSNEGQGLALTA